MAAAGGGRRGRGAGGGGGYLGFPPVATRGERRKQGESHRRKLSISRDKIAEHIESKKYLANLQGMLPDLETQLEEILFKVHGCKRDYYNMVERLFEPELQLAIQLLSVQNPQNQELSRNIQTFPVIGTDFWAPGSIKGESGNPMMYSDVTYKMGLASSSPIGMVLQQSANMGNSVPGKHPKGDGGEGGPKGTEVQLSSPHERAGGCVVHHMRPHLLRELHQGLYPGSEKVPYLPEEAEPAQFPPALPPGDKLARAAAPT